VPRKEGGIARAVGDYHSKITDIATILLTEFRGLFGEDLMTGSLPCDQDAVNERCCNDCIVHFMIEIYAFVTSLCGDLYLLYDMFMW